MSYPKSHHLQPEKYPKMEGHCTASGKSCLSDTHLAVTERGSTAAGQHSQQYTKETESSAFRLGFHNQWSELCVFSETPLGDSHWDPAPASSSGYTQQLCSSVGTKKDHANCPLGKKADIIRCTWKTKIRRQTLLDGAPPVSSVCSSGTLHRPERGGLVGVPWPSQQPAVAGGSAEGRATSTGPAKSRNYKWPPKVHQLNASCHHGLLLERRALPGAQHQHLTANIPPKCQ